ncbi:hypothetical protein GOB87_15345 [Acetobacter estunensis]|uniref:TonB-dependent receptor plug domain-containing protein n=1 Tax=Acetobacter estunensis TaxID=104097 RepID=A0A967B7G1_9PROT|nr:hypothetical protein [Acetobacter estunensis]NHO55295.1 hypothetical protein [Acetobacter estunensis]
MKNQRIFSTVLGLTLLASASSQAYAATSRKHGSSTPSGSVGARTSSSPPPNVTGRTATKSSRARSALAKGSETVGVVGARRTHGTSVSVGQAMIAKSIPGTNPLKVLAQLPGVMFQSDDPQGMDTWSNQF